MTNSQPPARHISSYMEGMSNIPGSIKRFTLRVGKTLVHFSHRGINIPARYRLQLIDENRMATVWSFSGPRRRLVLFAVVLFFVITIAGAALIGVTPLRTLLPGYLKRSQRYEMNEMSARVDSLSRIAAVNNMYLDNMVAIINDEIDLDSINRAYNDSINRLQLPVDSLLTTSGTEREFVRRFEQRERFNVSVLSPVAADGMIFYPPVTSPLSQSTEPSGRINYQLSPGSPVSAIYRGTVVDTYYVPGNGYTVILQHPHDFLSRYTGLSTALVERGDKVNAGARVGLSSTITSSDRPAVTFEMWYNGSRLDPSSYIDQ